MTALIKSNNLFPIVTVTDPTIRINNDYIKAATSSNTRKAYSSDIRHFKYNGGLLPATSEYIIAYLQKNAAILNPRTLSRRLTALKQWHLCQGFSDPTNHPMVRKTLAGIMNVHGIPKNKALALTVEQFAQTVKILSDSDLLINYRDSALLQIGFFGAFRRSELVNIKVEHIKELREGMEILIPRSKTDQIGQGKICAIPYGNKDKLCPVTALTRWLNKANIKNGAVFRTITKNNILGDTALVAESVTLILRKTIAKLNTLNAKKFSSHSLRRGFATAASKNGASLPSIMRQGRWQHEGTVIEYIEESQLFENNAADLILNIINK
jgi:integrase